MITKFELMLHLELAKDDSLINFSCLTIKDVIKIENTDIWRVVFNEEPLILDVESEGSVYKAKGLTLDMQREAKPITKLELIELFKHIKDSDEIDFAGLTFHRTKNRTAYWQVVFDEVIHPIDIPYSVKCVRLI